MAANLIPGSVTDPQGKIVENDKAGHQMSFSVLENTVKCGCAHVYIYYINNKTN